MHFLNIGTLFFSKASAVSGAALLAAGYAQAFALDFTDDSAWIKDTGTPANDLDLSSGLSLSSTLTYTAPSLKMTMGPTGTLRFQAHNLFAYSEQFDNAAWLKSELTVSADAIAGPGGQTTADKIVESTANSPHYVAALGMPIIAGATYTLSIDAKAGERSWLVVSQGGHFSPNEVWFNLSTGTIGTNAGGDTVSIEDLGNGWYRCNVTETAVSTGSSGVMYYKIADADNSNTYLGDGTSGLYVANAHYRRTPSDSTYLATTSAARYALPLEWDSAGNALGLLVEEARTNLVTYSYAGRTGALATNWYGYDSTFSAATSLAPDGSADGIKVTTTGNSGLNIAQTINGLTIGQTYTASCWVKGVADDQIYFLANDSAAGQELVTFTGEWQFVEKTFTAVATLQYIGFERYNRTDPGSPLPDTVFEVWGAQYELGAFPTSYIPTLGSTVTRAADNISKATSGFATSTDSNTFYVEASQLAAGIANGIPFAMTPNGTNRATVFVSNVGAVNARVTASGGAANPTSGVTVTATSTNKYALAYAIGTNQSNIVVNGTNGTASSPSGTFSSFTGCSIGSEAAASVWTGHVKKVLFVPERIADAALQTLTGA